MNIAEHHHHQLIDPCGMLVVSCLDVCSIELCTQKFSWLNANELRYYLKRRRHNMEVAMIMQLPIDWIIISKKFLRNIWWFWDVFFLKNLLYAKMTAKRTIYALEYFLSCDGVNKYSHLFSFEWFIKNMFSDWFVQERHT